MTGKKYKKTPTPPSKSKINPTTVKETKKSFRKHIRKTLPIYLYFIKPGYCWYMYQYSLKVITYNLYII